MSWLMTYIECCAGHSWNKQAEPQFKYSPFTSEHHFTAPAMEFFLQEQSSKHLYREKYSLNPHEERHTLLSWAEEPVQTESCLKKTWLCRIPSATFPFLVRNLFIKAKKYFKISPKEP